MANPQELAISSTQLMTKIVSQKQDDLDQQLHNALSWCSKYLNLELGIISHISPETNSYQIEEYFPTTAELSKEQQFKLSNTYCSIAIKNNEVLAIQEMGLSQYVPHACYDYFQLESYIGICFQVNGTAYGTVNFSSKEPRLTPFTDDEKQLVTFLGGWLSNIFYRKQMDAQMKHEHKLYKLISTNSAEMICMHKPDGTYTFITESVKDLLGYEPDELIGKSPYDFFHKEDMERIAEESHSQSLDGEHAPSIQYRIRKKDGNYVWFDTATQPILNDEGEVIHLQTTSREITEKKRLEILFSKSQKMAKVGGWELNLATNKLYWSDEVYRIHELPIGTNISVEEAINFYPIGNPRDTIISELERAISTGENWDIQLPIVTAKGNNIWVRALGEVEFADGEAIKIHGTFQDITERKLKEQKITDQINQLTELKNTREKLYSILAHDLRNSMYGISGLLSYLTSDINEGNFDEEDLTFKLNLVNDSADQAYKLLDNMLTWVKVQTGALQISKQSFDICNSITETISLLQPSLDTKNIKIQCYNAEHCLAYGEEKTVTTVIRNLINNAIKFSYQNDVINVSIYRSGNGESLNIRIKDFGTGMDEQTLKNLFNPTNRNINRGTADEKGSGLGLLLSKELMELNGGDIMAHSEFGKGSEFIITLPVAMSKKLAC